MSLAFPRAPLGALSPSGAPLAGAYAGSLEHVDLAPLLGGGVQGRLREVLGHKRWIWASVSTADVLLSLAIIDAGYVTKGFACAIDLAQGGVLFDGSWIGLPRASAEVGPHPGDGARARFHVPGVELRVERRGRGFELHVAHRRLRCTAALDVDGAPAPLSVVMPVGASGELDCTVKTVSHAVRGTLEVDGRTFALEGGHGGLDYTAGTLPRRTSWRWAFGVGATAAGQPLALNLLEGLATGAVREDAVWLDGAPHPVGRASFVFDRGRPEAPWRVRTDDGAVDLELAPRGLHREALDVKLLRTDFLQVGGLWRGTVRGPDGRTHAVERLAGFGEDQTALW